MKDSVFLNFKISKSFFEVKPRNNILETNL